MNLDIAAIKAALDRQENKGQPQQNDNLWKLDPGKGEATAQVRIVPYKFNPQNPFIELYFHYGFRGLGAALCPRRMSGYPGFESDTRECPLCEFGFEMLNEYRAAKTEAAKAKYKQYMDQFMAKQRTHVPVVVLSENGQPKDPKVRLWGFGNTVMTDLMRATVKFGEQGVDITDVENGVEFTVTAKAPEVTKLRFVTTDIEPAMEGMSVKTGPLASANDIQSILDTCPNAFDVYKPKLLSDLEGALESYMQARPADDESTPGTVKYESESKGESESTNVSLDEIGKQFAGMLNDEE